VLATIPDIRPNLQVQPDSSSNSKTSTTFEAARAIQPNTHSTTWPTTVQPQILPQSRATNPLSQPFHLQAQDSKSREPLQQEKWIKILWSGFTTFLSQHFTNFPAISQMCPTNTSEHNYHSQPLYPMTVVASPPTTPSEHGLGQMVIL